MQCEYLCARRITLFILFTSLWLLSITVSCMQPACWFLDLPWVMNKSHKQFKRNPIPPLQCGNSNGRYFRFVTSFFFLTLCCKNYMNFWWMACFVLLRWSMLIHVYAIVLIAASMISINLYNCYRNGRFLEKGQIFFGDMWLQSM